MPSCGFFYDDVDRPPRRPGVGGGKRRGATKPPLRRGKNKRKR